MTTVNRRRRHFRDDFKRKILSDIEAGNLNIHNIKDDAGKPIKALLVERWKDQFRTEGLGLGYEMPSIKIKSTPQPKMQASVSFNTDDLLKEIGRLEFENRQLRMLAYKVQTKISATASNESSKTSVAL